MEKDDNPRTHMQTMSRREERAGTRWMFMGAAVLAIAVGIGLVAWFFVPGFSAPKALQNTGILTDQTVGVSVQSQETQPLHVISPDSTGSYGVRRNEKLTATEDPNLRAFRPEQVKAIQSYAAAHPEQVMPSVDFSIAIGSAVPDSAKLLQIPPQLGATLPNYAKDMYFIVNGQFVVVESHTRRVVAIVPAPATRETVR